MKNILNHQLTDKTYEIFCTLSSSFLKPLEFKSIDDINIGGFGAADYWANGCYTIYLKTDLPKEAFETNLLHELFHIQQMEEGYPNLRNYSNSKDIEQEYIDDFGRRLQVCILDIDVERRLNLNGYYSSYFIKQRYKTIKTINKNKYSFDDNFDRQHFTIQFALFVSLASNSQKEFAIPYINSQFPGLTDDAVEISKKILDIGFDNPLRCIKCFSFLLNHFDIWKYHIIQIGEYIINNPSDLLHYLDNH